jgi:hypothetical protein
VPQYNQPPQQQQPPQQYPVPPQPYGPSQPPYPPVQYPQPYAQPPYVQPQYPPPQYPPPQQYGPPQPQYPAPQYPPPQQYGPPPQQYGPPQPQQQAYGPPPQQYPAAQSQQAYGQPIVIPVEGKGAAKLAARMNRRSLVISQEGFAHEGKKESFRIAWSELRKITIMTAYHQDRTKLLSTKVWRVRVVMDAADPGFVQRHPEIGGLQGKYGGSGPGSYGLPLGPANNMVDPLAQALGMYGGQIFGGVIEEGQVLGFTYL